MGIAGKLQDQVVEVDCFWCSVRVHHLMSTTLDWCPPCRPTMTSGAMDGCAAGSGRTGLPPLLVLSTCLFF